MKDRAQTIVAAAVLLFSACGCGDGNMSENGSEGEYTIRSAAEAGDLNAVADILANDSSLVNATAPPDENDSALHLAAWQGHLNVVRFLVEHGAQVNAVGEFGLTPLHYAAEHNQSQVVEFLLDSGADIEESSCGYTPLLWAAAKGIRGRESVELLIERGANLNVQDTNGRTLMQVAGLGGSTAVVQALNRRGVKLELHSALCVQDLDAVRRILRGDASAVARAPENLYLLPHAVHAIEGRLRREGLLEYEQPEDPGYNRAKAVMAENLDIIEALLSQGASRERGESALGYAVQMPGTSVAEVLLKYGVGITNEGKIPKFVSFAASGNMYCRDEMDRLLANYFRSK